MRKNLPYIVFLSVGIALTFLAFLLNSRETQTGSQFWTSLTSNFAAAVLTVVILQLLWSVIGGDPLNQELERLRIGINLLKDLGGCGIQRFFFRRDIILSERRDERQKIIRKVREVDLMGLTLWREWFEDDTLVEELEDIIKHRKGTVRILFINPCPDSSATAMRLKTNGERGKENLLAGLLSSTQERIRGILLKLTPEERKRFQVKITDETMYCSIIRTGTSIFISNYLFHTVGDETPAFLVDGAGTTVYELYQKEFDTMFIKGKWWKK